MEEVARRLDSIPAMGSPASVFEASRQANLILIVEDDFVFRTALVELLMAEGYEVECAADGLEAITRLDSGERRPSVILLDIGMPYMDGARFREVQRTLPGMADIPVIIISGHRSRLLHLKALGAREVFFKPLDAPKLLQTIRAL
jgi:CheY-like chemotaxis protein